MEATGTTFALRFVLSAFVYLDIAMGLNFSGASLQLHSLYSSGTQICSLQLSIITGCQDWAILHLAEVLQLQEWKYAARSHHSLSTKELARKAQDLETRLITGIAAIEGNDQERRLPRQDSLLSNLVTCVFARVAGTLLHAVASGFDCDLLEIREGVEHTRAALEKITDRKILMKLALPICVSASLASKDQEPFFRIVLAALQGSAPRKHGIVLSIVEECWESRDKMEGSEAHRDWAQIVGPYDLSLLVF